MNHTTDFLQEKAVLVGLDRNGDKIPIDASLNELEELVKTAGATTVGRLTQKRDRPNQSFCIGTGKLDELQDLVNLTEANMIVFDDELTPAQLRHLTDRFPVKVIDRTMLILDIFASRANSAEGKVQVELAQLRYSLSHLSGMGKMLSRLGGGIGTRGPGESKLEHDRRYIRNQIDRLNQELKEIDTQRSVLRERRKKEGIPIVSLVGYTNAGKSTLMNRLTGADVLAEDKLFATLTTTTRKIHLPSGSAALLTDTVGFIQKLPHHLVQAFRATLQELTYADVLLHVVDSKNPMREEQMDVVYTTLQALSCGETPIITLFNKTDEEIVRPLPHDKIARLCCEISAKTGKNEQAMLVALEELLQSFKQKISVLIPYANGKILHDIHETCDILQEEHQQEGTFLVLSATQEMRNKLHCFTI